MCKQFFETISALQPFPVHLCHSFLLLFETLSARDIAVPFTSPALAGRRFVQHFLTQIEYTQDTRKCHIKKQYFEIGFESLMIMKVLVQANLEYGQMREMVHSYQHRLAQVRLLIR